MTRNHRRSSAGTASGVFAMLSALLALFTVAFAFVVSQPSFDAAPAASHQA